MRGRSKLLIACFGSLGVAALVAGAATAGEPATATEAGVWQKHEYSFEFMGFTSTYSCDGLADQLQRLLLLSGARADAKARPGACASPFGRPDRFARATLVFYTLAPAAGGGKGEPATGLWRPVAISNRNPNELQSGDCELVEQFRDSVLKKMFTIRNLADHMTCVPHQESGSDISLRFETFALAPGAPPVAVAPPAPAHVYAYPKQGQSAAQQAKDRSECEASAATQGGADAQAPAGGTTAAGGAYARALAACLEGRGYTVR
jgi:hypothetical protein